MFIKKPFSLIELLVVVAVIAILFGMLAPALNKARGRAFATSCQANLKQVGTLLQNYAIDCAGVYPNADNKWNWGDSSGWTNLLAELSGDREAQKKLFRCPREKANNKFSYSLNCTEPYWKNGQQFCSWHSQDFDKARTPTSELIIVEETDWGADDCDIDNYTQNTYCTDIARHGNVTTLFVDGHVEPVRIFDTERMSYYTYTMSAWLPTLPVVPVTGSSPP